MSNSIYNKLLQKEAKLAVIGLGYVGLPIALEFARKIKVVGFDINQDRVDLMQKKIDPSNELETSAFDGCDIHFSADINDLNDVQFFIVAVPTPIDDANLAQLETFTGRNWHCWLKSLKKEIMWFLNQPFILDVRKKIVFQF